MTAASQSALLAFCLSLGSFSGCGPSQSTLYPAFPEQKKQFASVGIVMDYVLIDGLFGDTNKVDIVENKRVAARLLADCADSLRRKGYPVRTTSLSSMGLLMKRDGSYKVAQTADARAEDLQIAHAPFFIDTLFQPDTILEYLAHVYSSLINLPEKRPDVSFVIPEAMPIGKRIDCEMIAIFLAGGFNEPVSIGVGKSTVNRSATSGIVGLQSVSQLSMLFFVIDARNGEIIWDDRRSMSGGGLYPAKILALARE